MGGAGDLRRHPHYRRPRAPAAHRPDRRQLAGVLPTMTQYWNINYSLLGPELAVTALAFVVLAADLVWRRGNRRWLGWLTALGCLGVLGVVMRGEHGALWDGSYRIDAFALLFKAVFVVAAALVALASTDFAAKN